MRVLHVTCDLNFGGVESHLTTLARTAGARYEHHFCALQKGGAAADAIRAAGGDVIILRSDPWKRPLHAIGALAAWMREFRPSVVHGHGLEGNLIGMAAGWYSRVGVRIAEEIGIPEHRLKTRIALRGVYAISDRVIAISESVRNAVVQLGEAPARKMVRIYNPVELPERQASLRTSGEPFRIAFVGRLEPVKNALSLVQAVIYLPDDLPCRLLIIGDGSERSRIEEFIRSNGLESKVTLAGFHAKPDGLLRDCHLYVQPSRTEGLGIALVEAMGCGLPVIATSRGGMAEIVENGVNGWLLASGDPRDIADAIMRAAKLEPSVLAGMGKEARRSVEHRFEPALYLEQIEKLYDECLRQ